MKQRFLIGKISFQDPLILCGALAILLYFDASGFLRVGLLAAVLHEMGHIMAYLFLRHRFPHIEDKGRSLFGKRAAFTGRCRARGEHFAGGLGCFLPFPAGYHLVECLFCGKFVDRGF